MSTTTGTLGMSPTGDPQEVIVDTDTGALVVTTDLHNGVYEGVIYSHTFTASASTSGAFYFYSGPGESHMWIDGFATGGPNVTLVMYEGSSSGISSSGYSASAGMTNRKRSNSSASNIRIMTGSGTFQSTSGTALQSRYVGGGTGVGGTGTGSAIGGEEEWYVLPNTFYAYLYQLSAEQRISLRISARDY